MAAHPSVFQTVSEDNVRTSTLSGLYFREAKKKPCVASFLLAHPGSAMGAHKMLRRRMLGHRVMHVFGVALASYCWLQMLENRALRGE